MVQVLPNQGTYRISDVFGYLDDLFGKYPGRPPVSFMQVPESLVRMPLKAEGRWAITDGLFHATQNGQKYGRSVVVSVTEAGNGRIVFQVANEGRTMPLWQRLIYGRIPGFRSSDAVAAARGQGMGSVLIRRDIEALGGRLAVSARAGGGTVVKMTIPVAQTSAESTSTFLMRASRFANSGAKMLTKGATVFLLAVEAVPTAIEATYNIFDDPCNVYAREAWYNSVNNYYSQAGILGDIPSVPWYKRIGNSTQLMLNMVIPSSLTKFTAALDPFDGTAKKWISAKASACQADSVETM